MDAIEFQATVKNGKIEIPPEFRGQVKGRVRVILLVEQEANNQQNLIDQLLAHPVQVKNFQPLKRDDFCE